MYAHVRVRLSPRCVLTSLSLASLARRPFC
jgi:hypothetical protein